jgi:two-component system, chemotaxis family, chemotaxis protein CheY
MSAGRILIIDDDPHVRVTLQAILSRSGFDIECANDGEQGLRQFRACRPGVIITDIIMPDQDGVSAIGCIKREAPGTTVIAISGGGRIGNADMLKRARDAGADHILPKPFAMAELLALVRASFAEQNN